jgi:adenosylhomocysteine nucleosidase
MSPPMVIIHTALTAEAQPIIDHWQLKKHHSHGSMTLYTHPEQSLCLIISGIGSNAAAAAIAYAYAQQGCNKHAQIINIGIAGGEFELGCMLRVNKIHDLTTGRCYYPHLGSRKLQSANCHTVVKPEHDYQPSAIYDMESSGFFSTANQFVSVEQIQLLKIISDNSTEPTSSINKALVSKLITQNMETISAEIKQCQQQAKAAAIEHQPVDSMPLFLQRWHCTVAQQQQLQQRLKFISIHQPQRDCWQECQALGSMQAVLAYLQTSFKPEALS